VKRILLGLGVLVAPFVFASPVSADAITYDSWQWSPDPWDDYYPTPDDYYDDGYSSDDYFTCYSQYEGISRNGMEEFSEYCYVNGIPRNSTTNEQSYNFWTDDWKVVALIVGTLAYLLNYIKRQMN